ncbi:MAG: hypothetical protein Q9218_006744 [Villophora microphyllina]
MSKWPAAFIPSGCKSLTQQQNLSAADVTTYAIQYDDCSEPWVVCYHKDSYAPLSVMVEMLGRLPVHTRQWVRHVVTLPDKDAWAQNVDGDIAFYGEAMSNLNIYIHESGHSLDLLGAYNGYRNYTWAEAVHHGLSSSEEWLENYNQDSMVPDPYAQTNQRENVAQNTVITSYQRNVPGGFTGLNPNASTIFHQWAAIDTNQREAYNATTGEAGNLLIPGGVCTKRLPNNDAVLVDDSYAGPFSRIMAALLKGKPDTALSEGMELIEEVSFNTGDSCKEAFGVRN